MRWQDATQQFDEMVGRIYNLNRAERHCLSVLWHGPLAPSVIAREIGLAPASVTALVDRLEARGWVVRRPDPDDRRKTQIAITDQTAAMARQVYRPVAQAGAARLRTYSDAELRAIMKFLSDALAIQEEATAHLSERAEAGGPMPSADLKMPAETPRPGGSGKTSPVLGSTRRRARR
jgi:DNA-binding MarR family transcriptional regulator